MHFSFKTGLLALLVTSATAASLNRKAACNADNCLRAVRASSVKPGPASASRDCVSFLASTVTPTPATSTVTTTVTVTSVFDTPLAARAVTSLATGAASTSAIPTYASACSGAARYSSACSCIGASGTTVTAPQSTTTSTVTVTTTVAGGLASGACRDIKYPECTGGVLSQYYFANGPFPEGYPESKPSNYYLTEGLSPMSSGQSEYVAYDFIPQPSGGEYPVVYPTNIYPYYVGWTRDVTTLSPVLTVDANNFTIVYQGYFVAPATGDYQFCTSSDNANDLFVGSDSAFACGTGVAPTTAVPLASSRGANSVNPYACGTIYLEQGSTYPFRSVAANSQGPSSLDTYFVLPGSNEQTRYFGNAFPFDISGSCFA